MKGIGCFFGRVDQDTTWFFHAPVPRGTTEDNFDFDAYLHKAVGAEVDLEIERTGVWDLRVSIAQDYRKNRIFFAGDAAHSHPPYGGFGITTGFEDARNLGWKLAADLKGLDGQDLLDSYDMERRPVFESTAKDYIKTDNAFLREFSSEKDLKAFEETWSGRRSGTAKDVANFEPKYEGCDVVFAPQGGKCSAVGQHLFSVRAGHHLPPPDPVERTQYLRGTGQWFYSDCAGCRRRRCCALKDAADGLDNPVKIIKDTFEDDAKSMNAA